MVQGIVSRFSLLNSYRFEALTVNPYPIRWFQRIQVWCISVAWFFLLIDNSGGQMVKYFGLRTPFHKAAESEWLKKAGGSVVVFWGNNMEKLWKIDKQNGKLWI